MSKMNFVTRFGKSAVLAACLIVSASAASSAQISVLGNTVEEKTAVPGETYIGTLVIRNLTKTTQPARVYQTDYVFTADGTSRFDTPGSLKRSNAKWITPSTTTVMLPPSGEMTISYVVKVPPIDSLNGSYWSAIMVEGASTQASGNGKQQVGLAAVMRYAVQIATHIRETGSKTVAFSNNKFTVAADATHLLQLDVLNNGARAYHPKMWLELYDADGKMKNRLEQQRGLLYPGTSLRQTFALGKLAPGSYKAIVFADTGDDQISAAQYLLKF
jgi:hypothetical protein